MEEISATILKYQPLRVLWQSLCGYIRRTARFAHIRTQELIPLLFEELIT